LEWEKECERFFGAMKRFDDYFGVGCAAPGAD